MRDTVEKVVDRLVMHRAREGGPGGLPLKELLIYGSAIVVILGGMKAWIGAPIEKSLNKVAAQVEKLEGQIPELSAQLAGVAGRLDGFVEGMQAQTQALEAITASINRRPMVEQLLPPLSIGGAVPPPPGDP